MTSEKKSSLVAASSIAIGLSLASLIVFRGPLGITSSVTVPIILALVMRKNSLRDLAFTGVALVLLTFILAVTQTVFAALYLLLAVFIRIFLINSTANGINKLIMTAIYLLSVASAIYIGIRATEAVFGVPLHRMMLGFSNGNPIVYILIITVEALVIGGIHLMMTRILLGRFKNSSV